jgi:flagellar basal-body rod protein FlgG
MKSMLLVLGAVSLAGCQSGQAIGSRPVLDAAGSLTALQTRVDISANNIANAQTVGFKATRVIAEDAPYQDRAAGDRHAAARVGSGVIIARTFPDMAQGPAIQTSRPLDLMIDGKGFFILQDERPDGNVVYTRAGLFTLSSDGQMVSAGRAAVRMNPSISLPSDATQVNVNATGRVAVLRPGSSSPIEVGQIQIAFFVNPEGLRPIGGEMFVETAESGQPLDGDTGTDGRGMIRQGMLEGSNVNIAAEQIDLARSAALYESISRLAIGSAILASAPTR